MMIHDVSRLIQIDGNMNMYHFLQSMVFEDFPIGQLGVQVDCLGEAMRRNDDAKLELVFEAVRLGSAWF